MLPFKPCPHPKPVACSVACHALESFSLQLHGKTFLAQNSFIVFVAPVAVCFIQFPCSKPAFFSGINDHGFIYKVAYAVHVKAVFFICISYGLRFKKTFLLPHVIAFQKPVKDSAVFSKKLVHQIRVPVFRRNCYRKGNQLDSSPDAVVTTLDSWLMVCRVSISLSVRRETMF